MCLRGGTIKPARQAGVPRSLRGVAASPGKSHLAAMLIPSSEFRAALGAFATGVCVVTTRGEDGHPVGVTVNSFSSVSLDPPLVLFCLDRKGSAFPRFEAAGAWAIHVLAEAQQNLARRFARRRQEATMADPWADIAWAGDEAGLPVFPGSLARLACTAERIADGGDHAIMIGRVTRLDWQAEGRPLLYFRGRYEAVAEGVPA